MKSYKTINDENKLSRHLKSKSDIHNQNMHHNIGGSYNSNANTNSSTKTASGSNYKSTRLSDSHLGSLHREVLSDLTAQENYKSRVKSQQQQVSQQAHLHLPLQQSYPYSHHQHSSSNSNSSIGSGVATSGATLSQPKVQIYKQATQALHHYKKPRLERVSHREFGDDYTDDDLRSTSDDLAESSDDKENRNPTLTHSQLHLHEQHKLQHHQQHQQVQDLHNRIHDEVRYQPLQHQQQQQPLRSRDKYETHFKEEIEEDRFTSEELDDTSYRLKEDDDDRELRNQIAVKQSITRDSIAELYTKNLRNDDDLQTEKEVSMETTIRQDDSLSIHEQEEVHRQQQHHHHHQQQQQQTTSKSHSHSNRQHRTEAVTPMKPLWDLSIKMKLQRVVDQFSRTTLDENDEDTYDASMVAEYAPEIFNYMRSLEEKYKPDPYYMDTMQDELRWGMRAVLIDWVVQVHGKFNLLPETLFLTVNYIDRFLSKRKVSLSRFQLVGAVAFFIAAKYEEINCPTVQEVAFMADNAYSIDEFLKAERFMIDVLEFDMGWPGPMSFLRRTSKADDYDYETRTLAKYFLEITVMDARFVASPPSWLAAGAQYLSRLLLNRGEWTEAHVFYSGYTERQLRPLAEQLLENCRFAEKNHKAIFEKYLEKRFKRSSLFVKEYFDNF